MLPSEPAPSPSKLTSTGVPAGTVMVQYWPGCSSPVTPPLPRMSRRFSAPTFSVTS